MECLDLAMVLLRDPPARWGRFLVVAVGVPWLALAALSWASQGAFWVLPLGWLVSGALVAPVLVHGARQFFDAGHTWGATWREVRGRPGSALLLWAFDLVFFPLTCGLGGASVALGVFSWFPECLWLEAEPRRALARSATLAGGGGWNLVVAVVGSRIVAPLVCLMGLEWGGAAVWEVVLQGAPWGGGLTDGIVTPWTAGAPLVSGVVGTLWRFLLYVDTRTRAEGWDLRVALLAAAARR